MTTRRAAVILEVLADRKQSIAKRERTRYTDRQFPELVALVDEAPNGISIAPEGSVGTPTTLFKSVNDLLMECGENFATISVDLVDQELREIEADIAVRESNSSLSGL
jgi:hypothetical protein